MLSMGMEIAGIALGVIGFIMSIIVTAMPMWKVTAIIGTDIIAAQTIWQGRWINCIVSSSGQIQCKVYEPILALPLDLQAARAMTIISGVLGVMTSIFGAKCTNYIEDEAAKAKVMIIAGIFFILAGLLVPVSWSASKNIRDFYNSIFLTNPQRQELGVSLYIVWAAAALLMIGGAMLCSSCPPREKKRYKPLCMAYSSAVV